MCVLAGQVASGVEKWQPVCVSTVYRCNTVVVLDSDIAFSVTDCGPLKSPKKGTVMIIKSGMLTTNGEGAVATYICNSGYYWNGSNVRTCWLNGIWNGEMATCVCKYCLPMFVANSVVSGGLFKYCFLSDRLWPSREPRKWYCYNH